MLVVDGDRWRAVWRARVSLLRRSMFKVMNFKFVVVFHAMYLYAISNIIRLALIDLEAHIY